MLKACEDKNQELVTKEIAILQKTKFAKRRYCTRCTALGEMCT